MKKLSFLCILFLSICICSFIAQATSTKSGQTVVISEEVNDDLYVAAGNVVINADIKGDLLAGGGDILIQKSVEEDVMVMGGTLKIMGTIGDDLRVMGGTVNVQNAIEGDLIVAGGEVVIGKDAVINGAIEAVGGDITMEGTVAGACSIRAKKFTYTGKALNSFSAKSEEMKINGIIEGDSELSSPNLEIGQSAAFYANVEYWNSNKPINFDAALMNGAVANVNPGLKINESESYAKYFGAGFIAFIIYRIIVSVLVIALLIWLFHQFFSSSSVEISKDYFKHLGIGLLYVIGIPVVIGILFLTVIGIPFGVVLMMAYGLSLSLGIILASIIITYGYNNYYQKAWSRRKIFGIAVLVYLALRLIVAIPFLGSFISFIILMMVFGTLISYLWDTKKGQRNLSVN